VKRQVRDRIAQLELAAANRAPKRKGDEDEWRTALKEVALSGFPVFRAHVIEFLKLRGAQAAEDFAELGIGFHEEVHPGLEFRHEAQSLLAELGVIDPFEDPLCWCREVCYPKWSAGHQPR